MRTGREPTCPKLLDACPIVVDAVRDAHQWSLLYAGRLADVYDAWYEAEPDPGHDAQAVEWRARAGGEDG